MPRAARSRAALHGGEPVTSAAAWPAWPRWDECEERALQEVLASGRWQAGPQVEAFEEDFARYQDADHAVCVTNGTSSLELALRALGVGSGDEVIVPCYTFAATALAVLAVGARPVFADVREEALDIDPAAVEEALGERTRAIVPVHVGGHPVDLDAITALAQREGLFVVEDAAHAHGAAWRGRRIGAHGACASFSFQTGKSMTSGDGGCLTTSDATLAERLRSHRSFGRSADGTIEREGGNHRMTEFQAAVLRCQLARLDAQIDVRRQNVERLAGALEGVEGVRLARHDERVTRHPYYQVVLHYQPEVFGLPKDRLLAALAAEGVPLEAGYEPLHRMHVFRDACAAGRARTLACPVGERAADAGVLWLSFRMALASPQQIDTVAQALAKVQAHAEALRGTAEAS